MPNICGNLLEFAIIAAGVIILFSIVINASRNSDSEYDRSEQLLIGLLMIAGLSMVAFLAYTFLHLRGC